MSKAKDFLNIYEGEETKEAYELYDLLRMEAENSLDIVDVVDGPSGVKLLKEAAELLSMAERIGYRFQAMQREPIRPDAIFVEDLSHHELTLTMGGSRSHRADWKDREDHCVRSFLETKFPNVSDFLADH